MNLLLSILGLLIAYGIGAIPTALLIGRLRGVDIRQFGSGNIGATNVFRVIGKLWGIICLLLDIFKGWLPTALPIPAWFGSEWPMDSWRWAVGLAAIAGHMFSPFLKFRGGKGVATSIGVLLAIAPLPVLLALLVGLFIIWWTGYVSMASIICSAMLPVLILVLQFDQNPWISVVITALLAVLIFWRHRTNIRRLRDGTEPKLFDKPRAGEGQGGQ